MKIFIDAGHGGKDPGAIGNGLQEKDINLSVALKLKAILEKYSIEIKMSRSDDTYLTINERYQLANAWNADYFISIHCNAGGGTGVETLYYKAQIARPTHKRYRVRLLMLWDYVTEALSIGIM